MNIYLVNIVIIAIYSFFYNLIKNKNKDKQKIKKIFVIIITIQLFLILALRSNSVGVDVNRYITEFYNISSSSISELLLHRYELGYKFLMKFIAIFTESKQIFLTIIAALSIFPVGRLIYKYSSMPFLSFTIYISFNFYAFIFSGLRQALAFSLVYISYDFIMEKKPAKFLITIILAILFHNSALFFLPAYVISNVKLSKVKLLISIISFIVIYIFRAPIMSFVTSYIFEDYDVVESTSIQWLLLSLLIYGGCLLFYKNTVEKNPQSNGLYILVGFGIYLMLFATVATNAMRIANYYYVFSILLIPEVISALKNKKLAVFVSYVLIIGLIILMLMFLINDGYNIVPYLFLN